jgi:lysophospholipase L1-like esterase
MSSPASRRWVRLLVAIVVVGLLAAGLWLRSDDVMRNSSAEDDRTRLSVAVLGDSITQLSANDIHSTLDSTYNVEIDATPGITVAGQWSEAAAFAKAQPDIAVVNLGTNDLLARRTADAVIRDLEALLAEFDPSTCVVVVTISTTETRESFRREAVAVNRWLRDRPHVADWDGAVARSPFPRGLTYDSVHPTEDGRAVLAEVLLDGVSTCRDERGIQRA